MTVTVSSGGYANSVGSPERRVMGKCGGRALTPFSLPGASPCVPPIRNSKTRYLNSDGEGGSFVQPMRNAVRLRRAGRIRKPKLEPNRKMERTFFSGMHPHLSEDGAISSAGLPVYADLFRIHGAGHPTSRGVTRPLARHLPCRTVSSVSSRWLRSCARNAVAANTRPYGKFVWRCF